MTRIEILNSNLATLQAEKLTAVGSVLRLINRRIVSIQNVLLREMNYPHNSEDLSSASLNTKFDKSDVLDLKWLGEHGMTTEELKGKVFDALVVHNLLDEFLSKIRELQAPQGQNYDPSQFTVLPSGKVGINTESPIENLHLKWGHFLIEGGNLKFKNGLNTTLNFVNFDDTNIFNVANNLLKLDPTWGSTALKIDGGLVSSNVPIFINNSDSHFIVMTGNGICRKLVFADDGTISGVVVPHP